MSENSLVFVSILGAFWTPQNGSKINEKSIIGLILGQDGSKDVSSWANTVPRTDFEWFCNRFLNHFRLMSDHFWTYSCSLQEPFFTFSESLLDYFRLMSDQCWIDVYSMLLWIGLMCTRCWDRFSSDLRHIYTNLNCDSHWQVSSLTCANITDKIPNMQDMYFNLNSAP